MLLQQHEILNFVNESLMSRHLDVQTLVPLASLRSPDYDKFDWLGAGFSMLQSVMLYALLGAAAAQCELLAGQKGAERSSGVKHHRATPPWLPSMWRVCDLLTITPSVSFINLNHFAHLSVSGTAANRNGP